MQLVYTLQSKEETREGPLTPMGGRVGGWEKAEQGHLWDWIEGRQRQRRAQGHEPGQHTEVVFGEQESHGALWAPLWCMGEPWGVWKGGYPDISKVCYLRCRKSVDGSLKGKTDLCRDAADLGQTRPAQRQDCMIRPSYAVPFSSESIGPTCWPPLSLSG